MHPNINPDWLPDRAIYRFDEISPERTALLVIDMQVVFVEEGQIGAGPHAASIIPNINRMASTLRDAGGLVAFTRHTVVDDGPRAMPVWQREWPRRAPLIPLIREGAREHEIDSRLELDARDVVVNKHRYSALTHDSSDLNTILSDRGIESVIISGVVSNGCCESTARDASMLGYWTYYLEDANAAISDEEHTAAITSLSTIFADVRSTDSMIGHIADHAVTRQR